MRRLSGSLSGSAAGASARGASATGARAIGAVAAGPTRSYAGSKRALNRMLYPDLEGQLSLEAELQHGLARTRDFQEGALAFLEKREPAFQGA